MRQLQESIRPLERISAGLQSNWECLRQAWERQQQCWEHQGAPATNLGAPATDLGAPGTSLEAFQTIVEHSGKNIFSGNAAGAPRNQSYYLLFNDFLNSCILFVFSSMYLCIYIATHLNSVYLDRMQPVIDSNSRCTSK